MYTSIRIFSLHGVRKTAKKTNLLKGGRYKETTMPNLNDNLALFEPIASNKVESHRPLRVNRNGVRPQRLTLLEIGELVKHRKTLRLLKIWKLKIQRKRRRGPRAGHEQRRRKMMMKDKLMRKADHPNLIHVQIDRDRHVKTRQVNLVLELANVSSGKTFYCTPPRLEGNFLMGLQ